MRIYVRKMAKLFAAVSAITVASGSASAGTATGVMPISAISLAACAVVPTTMSFGTLSQLDGNPNDSTALITVTCTPGTDYSVGLDDGLYASGGIRRMKEAVASDYVEYSLYSDSTRTTAWGDTVGSDTVDQTAGLVADVLTVYGRVAADADIAPIGVYADTVTVTVTF